MSSKESLIFPGNSFDAEFKVIGEFLEKQMCRLWETEVSVQINTHPYSKRVFVNVTPRVACGSPGTDYPVLKLTMDEKSRALELRLMEQPMNQSRQGAAYQVLADLAEQLGDWRLVEAYTSETVL